MVSATESATSPRSASHAGTPISTQYGLPRVRHPTSAVALWHPFERNIRPLTGSSQRSWLASMQHTSPRGRPSVSPVRRALWVRRN